MKAISAHKHQQIVGAAAFLLVLIILTGAAVRLTQSGLGCEDWPTCSDGDFVPEFAFHSWIEFGNRLLTGVIGVVVIAAALATFWRTPRRKDLDRWALGLVLGVGAQGVLGGLTVKVDLHPIFVSLHFLLSIVLLWNVVVLWLKCRTAPATGRARPRHNKRLIGLSRAMLLVATLVLAVGTLVTGTGPNSGDESAVRLSFSLQTIARVHSGTAWALVVLIVWLAMRTMRQTTHGGSLDRADMRRLQGLLFATVAQGAVGYVQYALGVPGWIVEIHIAGAICVWTAALWFHLLLFERVPESRASTGEERSV